MIIGLMRDERFSPNSVEKDRAIMEAVMERLHGVVIAERDVARLSSSQSVCLNMGRLPETLAHLKRLEDGGTLVLNSAYGVERCSRCRLDALTREKHLPVPPVSGSDGYWLKSDGAAQGRDDVVFCADDEALRAAQAAMTKRGISRWVVQAHVKGDLVKFYGVEGTGFFRTFYPGDDGQTKFGDERRNGRPHHYFYERRNLQASAELLSRLVDVPIYGGDAVVTADGDFFIIDFNDWPSFSRCREEAAEAIVQLIRYRI